MRRENLGKFLLYTLLRYFFLQHIVLYMYVQYTVQCTVYTLQYMYKGVPRNFAYKARAKLAMKQTLSD